MGTFHSIFSRILRTEGDKLGYKSNYTIYDSSDSKSLLRAIIKELNLDDNTYKPGNIASRISAAKNNLVTASIYSSDSATYEYDKSSRMPLLAEIYRSMPRCYRQMQDLMIFCLIRISCFAIFQMCWRNTNRNSHIFL